MAKKVKRRPRKQPEIGDFLPAVPEIVKAIAMQGSTDTEIAVMMGLDPKIVKAWRKMYPDFDKALEEGRTIADAMVLEALHKKAVGYNYEKDIVVRGKGGAEIHTVRHIVEPETNAIKFWLGNRDPKRWSERRHLQHSGKDGEPPVMHGIKSETKVELMSSILSLIQPKPDGV